MVRTNLDFRPEHLIAGSIDISGIIQEVEEKRAHFAELAGEPIHVLGVDMAEPMRTGNHLVTVWFIRESQMGGYNEEKP